MADVQTCTGGIREHIKNIIFRLGRIKFGKVWDVEVTTFGPARLPLALERSKIVGDRLGCRIVRRRVGRIAGRRGTSKGEAEQRRAQGKEGAGFKVAPRNESGGAGGGMQGGC